MSKNNKNRIDYKKLSVIILTAVILIVVAYSIKKPDNTNGEADTSTTSGIPVAEDSDIVISVKDITETAAFYPAKINGTELEVIAVKAPDGTIRTAFNTCQVCYSSGRGYYQQKGDQLECQNCGNLFGMDEVEVTKGGCNPVPITSEYKLVDNDTIIISKEYLTEAIVIFDNWK